MTLDATSLIRDASAIDEPPRPSQVGECERVVQDMLKFPKAPTAANSLTYSSFVDYASKLCTHPCVCTHSLVCMHEDPG